MKTLGEILSLLVDYGGSSGAAEYHLGKGNEVKYNECANLTKSSYANLFASLAAWDAVVREALPDLELEYESLQDDSNGTGTDEGLKARVGHGLQWELTTTGLARLEYLRGILGEEAP